MGTTFFQKLCDSSAVCLGASYGVLFQHKPQNSLDSNSIALVFVIWTPNTTSQTGLKQIRVKHSPNKKLCLVSTSSSTAHSGVNICIPFRVNSFSTPDIHKSLLTQIQPSECTPCASRQLYLCRPNSMLLHQVLQDRSSIYPFYFNLRQQLLDPINNKKDLS